MDEETYEVHPAANLFPMLEGTALRELAEDIKQHGLLEPIAVHDGKIIDGRNRCAACQLVGVAARYEVVDLKELSPTLWVVSKNLHRRHLTTSQRATIAAEAFPLIQEETLARQREHGGTAPGRKRTLPANSPEVISPSETNKSRGEARHIAAQALQVGGRTVQTARAVQKADPALFERVKRGEITLHEAERKIERAASPRRSSPLRDPAKEGVRERHARQRMISGLSQIRGLVRGLSTMNSARLTRAFTPEELKTWRGIANQIARQLREFAQTLTGEVAA